MVKTVIIIIIISSSSSSIGMEKIVTALTYQ